jgi:hypothetical protein
VLQINWNATEFRPDYWVGINRNGVKIKPIQALGSVVDGSGNGRDKDHRGNATYDHTASFHGNPKHDQTSETTEIRVVVPNGLELQFGEGGINVVV